MYNDLRPVTSELCSANNKVALHDKMEKQKIDRAFELFTHFLSFPRMICATDFKACVQWPNLI